MTDTAPPLRISALRHAVTPATEIFLWSRVAIWAGAALVFAWFPQHHRGGYGTSLWVRWDSNWFLRIAHHGYGTDAVHAPAFFPLYPALMAGLGRAFGNFALAGLLISLVSGVVAFELLWRLAVPRLGAVGASRAVVYLAVFPMALFLQAVYSESLFLALALAAFWFAERGHWPAAGVASAGALLTRSVGIAVLAALAVMAWPSVKRLAWLAIAPVAFLSFPLVLRHQVHDAWAFLHDQSQWQRRLSPAGPFGGIWDGIAAFGRHAHHSTESFYWAVNVESFAFLVLFLALLPLVWLRLGAAYGVFATVALALPLSFPASTGDFPLFSLPRFGVLIFPYFLVLGSLGSRPRAHTAIVAISAMLLGVAVAQWATFHWVS